MEAERFDGPVHLPRCVFQAFIVANLDVVAADLLVGADLVVSLGGIRLEHGEAQQLCGVHFGPGGNAHAAATVTTLEVVEKGSEKHSTRGVVVMQDVMMSS